MRQIFGISSFRPHPKPFSDPQEVPYGHLPFRLEVLEKVSSARHPRQSLFPCRYFMRSAAAPALGGHHRLCDRLRPFLARRRGLHPISFRRQPRRARFGGALFAPRPHVCGRLSRPHRAPVCEERHLPVVRRRHGVHPPRRNVRQAFGARRRNALPLQRGRAPHHDEPRYHLLQGAVFAYAPQHLRFGHRHRALRHYAHHARLAAFIPPRRRRALLHGRARALFEAGESALQGDPRELFRHQFDGAGEHRRRAHRALFRGRGDGDAQVRPRQRARLCAQQKGSQALRQVQQHLHALPAGGVCGHRLRGVRARFERQHRPRRAHGGDDVRHQDHLAHHADQPLLLHDAESARLGRAAQKVPHRRGRHPRQPRPPHCAAKAALPL